MRWLLADKYKDPPVCECDLERPYTAEVFRIARAEVTDPRIDPLDIRSIENILAVTYDRLCDAACQAYHADEIIHFHYAVREFLEGLDARWPDSPPRDKSMDVAETAAKSRACLEAARQQKLLSNIGQP